MGKYLLRRLINYVILLFVAVSLAYFIAATALHPRAVYEVMNPPMNPESIERSLLRYNLSDNVPILQRYWYWLTHALQGEWGFSPRGQDVGAEIGRRWIVSIRLLLIGSVVGILVGVAAGAWAATRQYSVRDRGVNFLSLLLLSTPAFVTATLLIILATQFNIAVGSTIFEFTGETGERGDYPLAWLVDRLQHLFLPTLVLILVNFATFARIQRNLMLDTLGADYVRTARAKGLRKQKAVMKHALRTSLIPTGTYFAFSVATLFTGATVTETIFAFNGMGRYGVSTILGNDVNGTVAVVAFSGVCVLVGAMLSDVMVAVLDPRVRLS
jgi:peptide/nickel transport system permease protein